MSKELTPLEAYNRLCSHLDYDNSDYMHNGSYEEDNEIIEKALKRLEKIDLYFKVDIDNKFHNYIDLTPIDKKLKALEIIKEKGCLQFCMLGVSLEDYNKSVDSVNKYKYSGMENYKHYTQEEFDLLKEVLK